MGVLGVVPLREGGYVLARRRGDDRETHAGWFGWEVKAVKLRHDGRSCPL